ncbi:MAG: hypothetical protein WC760_06625 [Bacteroidia bacterium]
MTFSKSCIKVLSMMKKYVYLLLCIFLVAGINSCKKDEEDIPEPVVKMVNTIPEFYKESREGEYATKAPQIRQIANSQFELDNPQDFDFHPMRPNEIWIINKGTEGTGGNTIILQKAGEVDQSYLSRKDGNAWHFMSLPSGMAFSENGNWANSANVLDANHSGGSYTGPALWSGDLNIFAKPSGGNGSHLDMVHQSPYTMGIAAEKDNVFWVFDGYYGNIIRYDFVEDHGPGNDYHGDARLRRYTEVSVKRNPDVPSHLILDEQKKWLYIVDGGNKRILRMDITTGMVSMSLPPIDEDLAEYSRMKDVVWESVIDKNLENPCGIEVSANRLFVSDYANGDIICYDLNTRQELGRLKTGKPGITGIKLYNGKLWYLNALENTCNVVEPQ